MVRIRAVLDFAVTVFGEDDYVELELLGWLWLVHGKSPLHLLGLIESSLQRLLACFYLYTLVLLGCVGLNR